MRDSNRTNPTSREPWWLSLVDDRFNQITFADEASYVVGEEGNQVRVDVFIPGENGLWGGAPSSSQSPAATGTTDERPRTASRTRRPASSLTPPQVAARFGVKADKVLNWIRNGELEAVNVATKPNGRPRYAVSTESLAAFEAKRRNVPPVVSTPRSRRRDKDVTEYF